jgi:hypothetical protein
MRTSQPQKENMYLSPDAKGKPEQGKKKESEIML